MWTRTGARNRGWAGEGPRMASAAGAATSQARRMFGAVKDDAILARNLIGTMVQDMLVKKQSPEQALQTFVTQAKAIYDKYPNL